MKLTIREVGDVVIMDAHGDIMIGEGDVQLRNMVLELLSQGRKNLLLNLGKVGFIDSAGIGEIVRCHTTVVKQGGRIKLLNLTRKIREVLTITRLITVLDHYDNEIDAISSFS